MKKATLLTFLFAILMIALLVSCNTTPDPLPDESTSDEVTPEPTDVTSDEAEVSELVETTEEHVTTEIPETGNAATTEFPYETILDQGGNSYIALEPTVTPFPSDPEGSVIQLPAGECPWHIAEWETGIELVEKTVSEEEKGLALRFPEACVAEHENFCISFDFFEEYYKLSDRPQVRVTIENKSESPLAVVPPYYYAPVSLVEGKSFFPKLKGISYSIFSTENGNDQTELPKRYNKNVYFECSRYSKSIRFDIYPTGQDAPTRTPGSYFCDSFGNGVAVLEYVFTTSGISFSTEGTYGVFCYLIVGSFENDPTDVQTFGKFIVQIPIEIVQFEVKPLDTE